MLPLSSKSAVFGQKVHFSQRKSATKFSLCENRQQVVRLLLPYLSRQKWLVADIPFCMKI